MSWHPPRLVRGTWRAVALGERSERLWLLAALALSLYFAARIMLPARDPGLVQDDARDHVFWMLRWRDPDLFPGDPAADYFAALAPIGYRALYALLNPLIDPWTASKLLAPLLGLLAALFTFLLTRAVGGSPLAALLASLMLSALGWQRDDLSAAIPRAFVLPFLTAQLWALARGHRRLLALLPAAAAAFYPVVGLLNLALFGLSLVQLDRGRLRLPGWRAGATLLLATLLVILVQVPTLLAASSFGAVVDAATAQSMPDFSQGGRIPFYVADPIRFWLVNQNSGLRLPILQNPLTSWPLLAGWLALPTLLLLGTSSGPFACAFRPAAALLARLLLASLALFLAAHLVAFQLYLPTRYVHWSLFVALALAFGLVGAWPLELTPRRRWAQTAVALAGGLVLLLAARLVFDPLTSAGFFAADPHPRVSAYLRTLPKDLLVAAVPSDGDSLPAFAERSVLVNREYALPWHAGYYAQVRQRALDLIAAYYAESPAQVVDFARRYNVGLFLVNRSAFDPDTARQVWAGQFSLRWEPYTGLVADQLGRGAGRFALLEAAVRCAVLFEGEVAVVPLSCLTG
jgi:hypothetical protein